MNILKTTTALVAAALMTTSAMADDFTFRLRNSLGFARMGETVEVAVPEDINISAATLHDESGDVVPFEAAGDNTIRFRANVERGATMGYTLTAGTPTAPAKATYAAVKMPSNRADIAWENDLCAYRMYSSVLLKSEPNTAQGVDVWFKKRATPVIDDMYNLSNYHNESQYGVDAYSVNGKRLGCGGTAVVEGGHLVMHNPYNTCTITEQSALRSAFTLTYNNVKVGGQDYTKTLSVETTAGALLNRATVRFDGPAATIRLAVAVYQHTDMTHLVEGAAFTDVPGVVGWAEAKSEGSVTSAGARFFQGAYVPAAFNPETQVIDNHLCLVVDYQTGTDLTFYFGGGWSIFPEGRYTQDDEWFEALAQFKQTVEQPLAVTSMHDVISRDDVLAILNTVNETWQRRNANHGDYFWNRAVYHIGNMAAYDATGDQRYLDFSTAWAQKSNWWGATGTNKSQWQYKTYGEGANWVLFGDNQVCFQVYIDLYNLDPAHDAKKIERALEVMGYEISTSATDYLWWVDGLFMVMPIMTKLYNITGDANYLEKMYQYWQYANSIMYDNETGLYFRDAKYVYPAHKTNAGKKDFWARGDGWIFAAFAKVLADQAPGRETSGTALNTFAYAWGIRNGILDELEYGETLERAWNYLSTVALQEDGTVGYIQPIGENASPNTTVKATDYHDFGVGAYLLAASEMSRLATGDFELPKLRMTDVRINEADAKILAISFNVAPDAEEAAESSHYLLNGELLTTESIDVQDNIVTIHLTDSIDYGLYRLSVEGLHSAEGGELAPNQQRTLLRTVPLDAKQTGITISAIGSQSGNPYSNVNDGKLSTRWSQEGTNQWIRFDLKDVKSVWAVDVAFYNGDQRVFYFKVQTSTDNRTWTDVTGNLASSGMTNEMERYRFEPVEARYVRLLCSGNSTNKWNSPTEIRIRFDELDAIEDLMPEPSSEVDGSENWYDLAGRKTTPVRKGIYIVNGKKVLVK